ETYRAYVRQAYPERALPARVRDGLGFYSPWLSQPFDPDPATAAFRIRDIPRLARDALASGIDVMVPWGWCDYFLLPIPLRRELGTREELLAGIKEAEAAGVTVAPF